MTVRTGAAQPIMLLDLEIRDFVIIDSLRIEFGAGMNALTGETGAGKSIIIDALGAVLGERVSSEQVRAGATRSFVDARFRVDDPSIAVLASDLGIDVQDGELILSREIQASGRSTARINGRVSTAQTLARIGQSLVDIHGQSDHLSLLRADAQREILDRYARVSGLRVDVSQAVKAWNAARRQLETIDAGARERARRIDLLSYQVGEIESAAPKTGEDAELEIELGRLSNVERLAELVSLAVISVGGDGMAETSAGDLLRKAAKSLADAAALDATLGPAMDRCLECSMLIDDLSLELRDYLDAMEADPQRLAEVQDRLDTLRNLKRKYGPTVDDVVEFGRVARAELEELEHSELDESALRQRIDVLEREVRRAADSLTSERRLAAHRLSHEASMAAADLNLGGMSFDVSVRPKPDSAPFDETGGDVVEFLFSPNAGESPKSLARVASGGETARMMLALKSVLADSDATPTLVFDEVDVGIGGRSGQMVGAKLRQISASHQVIVITHLPQIAAAADHHFKIQKSTVEGRTLSNVVRLDAADRIDELAAMIDGEPPSPSSRAAAREMLERMNGALWER